jgi:hypothetical protein
MGANDLNASLTLNSTKYEAAIARADARATAFANKVSGDLSKKVGKLFGAAAVTGAIFKPLHALSEGLFGGSDRAQKIRDEANSLKLTGEEYQMVAAAAKDSNMSVEEWLRTMRDSNTPIAAVVSELEKFRSAVQFTNDQLTNLTDRSFSNWIESIGNKIAKAKSFAVEGLAGTFTNIATFMGDKDKFKDPMGAIGRAQASLSEQEKQDALNRQSAGTSIGLAAALAGKSPVIASRSSSGGSDGVNALQRIGASVGGTNPMQQSLNVIAQNTQKTATGIEKIAEKVRNKEPVSVLDLLDGSWR